ncbi:hypothetical protein [uncultured Dysosmobacter sp.]|uniref:hypothetical protein n=1 Tax=uncultured Dysosmobacter sp. TaxID=2591384 RepID=UPI00261073BC|nr:hypothetical protein [uncultured Dysosmobacter sp.]
MRDGKRNARPAVPPAERAKQESHWVGGNPYENDSTVQARTQLKIADLLSHGQDNAVPLRQLVSMTGLDGRSVRQMIQAERLAGVPILSDNANGYFLPANDGERLRFIHSMRHRAAEITRTAEALEKLGGHSVRAKDRE